MYFVLCEFGFAIALFVTFLLKEGDEVPSKK
jgi:hypothetical protein